MTRNITILIAALLIADASAQTSIVFRNYVEDPDGDLNSETPPEASFAIWLDGDLDRILLDNAPRWEEDAEKAIPGNGSYNVELGNFMYPSPQVGDVVHSRFIANRTGTHMETSETITMIPWIRPPQTLSLSSAVLPPRPEDLTVALSGDDATLSWEAVAGVEYDVYGRYVDSLAPTGVPRMLYHRLASGVTSGSYTHVDGVLEGGMGYVVIPKKDGVYGSHSNEATNYPLPPKFVKASVAYSSPFKTAVTWGRDDRNALYHVYRGATEDFTPSPATLIGTTTHPTAFIDDDVAEFETHYYRVRGENASGLKGEFSKAVHCIVKARAESKPDLNVFYISRSPKYLRYKVEYEAGGYDPYIPEDAASWRHYPDEGETMTYLAHLENTGGATIDSFKVEWFVDSALQRTDYFGKFYPDQHMLSRFQLPWSSENPSYVRCELTAIAPAPTAELTLENNYIENRTNALGFDIHIEKGQYDNFRNWKNIMGSYAFEDWIQFHMITFHRFFEEAVYEHTPDGVDERVFIDSISYWPNNTLGGGTHAPVHWWADGAWGFNDNDEWFGIISTQHAQKGFDPGLMHELGHQLGLIDLYVTDVHGTTFSGDFVEPRTGEFPPLTPAAHFENPVYYYNSRARDDMMHGPSNAKLSDHSAGGLQRNRSKRRGWYGDYQFDFAKDYAYELTKPDGSPLANYKITIYQKDPSFTPTPKYIGMTNEDGRYQFPHTTHSGYEGGIYTANPFSTKASRFPQVVGTNSALLIRVTKGDSVGYTFHDLCDFNVAYWEGDTIYAVIPKTVEQWHVIPATNVERDPYESVLPKEYKLDNAFPNPFNPEARIKYDLKEKSVVELEIFNAVGERVAVLAEGTQPAGFYERTFRPTGASGVYFYRLTARSQESNETFVKTLKMIYLK